MVAGENALVSLFGRFVPLRTVHFPSGSIRLFSDAEAAAKPVLADALWPKLSSNTTSGPEGDVQHVLDGGALLHRIP